MFVSSYSPPYYMCGSERNHLAIEGKSTKVIEIDKSISITASDWSNMNHVDRQ